MLAKICCCLATLSAVLGCLSHFAIMKVLKKSSKDIKQVFLSNFLNEYLNIHVSFSHIITVMEKVRCRVWI